MTCRGTGRKPCPGCPDGRCGKCSYGMVTCDNCNGTGWE